jgi:hypothetical protein
MKQGHYDAAGIALSLLSGAAASAGAYVLWYTLFTLSRLYHRQYPSAQRSCLAMLGVWYSWMNH